MKKKILLTVLSFVLMVMSALSFASCNLIPPSWVKGVVYATSEDGTYAEVRGYANKREYERNGMVTRETYQGRVPEVKIADTYNGLPVKSIKKEAFAGVGVVSVVIPESVTSIGDNAFDHCYYLKSIKVADGNTEYKDIDGNLYTKDGKTLMQYATAKLKSKFTIPETVTTISDSAFYGCKWLKSVVIPESVTSIGDKAFANCRYLKSITVAEQNRKYTDRDGNLYTNDERTLIQYAIGKKEAKFIVREGVTTIGNQAFYGCDSLTSVVIPFSIETIGSQAFSNCNKLTGVYYRRSWNIGLNLGSDNSDLTRILYFYHETPPTTPGKYWYYNEDYEPTPW